MEWKIPLFKVLLAQFEVPSSEQTDLIVDLLLQLLSSGFFGV